MKYETVTLLTAFFGFSAAAPTPKADGAVIPRHILRGREVPQEHSHNRFLDSVRVSLNIDNPAGIKDPVFGLLGDAAAAAGAGTIKNLACLHQATADQAFTNSKAAGDVEGQANALLFAGLERNTQGVGTKSAACTDAAVNPEIQAVQQHQDPASPGAAATNKAIVLELAKQLKSIGADPQLALLTGTFSPGNLNDKSGKGNTCDTLDDAEGCIFTQKLIVNDATPDEINAAVGGAASAGGKASGGKASGGKASGGKVSAGGKKSAANDSGAKCPAQVTSTVVASPASTEASVAPVPAENQAPTPVSGSGGNNVQAFTGSLGGPPPPVISSAGDRPFSVNGATFVNIGAALQRSCAVQHNACANAANSKSISASVGDCGTQEDDCNAASSAKVKRAALDFGSCSNPSIEFAIGLDGRKESSFQANNQRDFNHGSALKIGVIAQFICGQLASSCKAGAATISACTAAESAAGALSGQASADAFNAALGV